MDVVQIARWQFATTTIYHFLIVPLTIGLTVLVATMQTFAYRGGDTPAGRAWDRSSRFWGRIMLTLFALGVVTGIVQEFQFGMNWSAYSRFVGDVFGAPLAMEGLVAFFLESTFLGVWIFGREILPRRVHLASIWLAAIGTVLSAYFILAANSWMQHPVGLRYDTATGRAEMTSIWKVLTNTTQLVTFPHTLFAAMMTAGAILLSVTAWHLRRFGDAAEPMHRKAGLLGVVVVLASTAGVSLVGHVQGQVMVKQQPMKMAAAEALWHGTDHAPFSLFAYGDVDQGRNKIDLTVPDGLSLLSTNSRDGYVEGVVDVQEAEEQQFGPGDYVPIVGLAYWSFRLMIGFGVLAGLVALAVGLQWFRGRLVQSTALLRVATWVVVLPLAANSFGWLFTETARQPWLVYGLLRTRDGISPTVGAGAMLTTLIGFTLLYGALGVVCLRFVLRFARQSAEPDDGSDDALQPDGFVPSLA